MSYITNDICLCSSSLSYSNNTLKRSSGTYKPEVPPVSDLSVTGLTDDSEVPLIK